MEAIKFGFFTNILKPAAVASDCSLASLSKLVIRAGKHCLTAETALS